MAKALLLLFLLIGFASSIFVSNYQACLKCFYGKPTSMMFCASNNLCLPSDSTACGYQFVVQNRNDCLQGYVNCMNVTFTEISGGVAQTQGFGLPGGYGCNIKIDKTENGTIGTMAVIYEGQNILVFDNQVTPYKSNTSLGLPVTETGWGPRTILVANAGEDPAGFQVTYVGGVMTTVSLLLVLASTVIMLL